MSAYVHIPSAAVSCALAPAIATSAQQMTDNGPLSTASRLDPHALPKRYAILNLRGCRFRLRVIPRGVVVLHAIDFHVVIVRDALPRTLRSMVARLQKFLFHGLCGKVLVPFHNHARLAFRDNFATPACLGHLDSLHAIRCLYPCAARNSTSIAYQIGCVRIVPRSMDSLRFC